ncbi:MAG: ATP-dependent DNA helicase RecQ, partial [Bacteroidota bacterium]
LIGQYVEENEVERPDDILIRQVANKSKVKVQIIQGIDRKMPLDDLAKSNQLTLDELLTEMEAIVESGTKLNIDYYIEEAIDEGARDEIYDYFMEAETDLLQPAIKSLQEEDITEEEIRIFRIKFLSDLAN